MGRKTKQNSRYKILIVDDEIEYQKVLSLILADLGYDTHCCSNGEDALSYWKSNQVDLLITDLKMPIMDGETLIKNIHQSGVNTDIIVITAYASIESAVDSMKYGAIDYFVKSRDLDELVLKIERVIKMRELERKNLILRGSIHNPQVFLDSKNPKYLEILETCHLTANSGINILLLGESGTGKEVIANHIHRLSNRCQEPFVAVNCQAFPPGVIESELFGHEKGAFTGAIGSRIGKFEQANYGTIFLDEIGDLPLETQGKLLRAIETRTIERLGSNKQINLDVKFISATNKDLSAKVADGSFREDLYYRINTLSLELPPLRERKEDIKELLNFFIIKTEADQKKKIRKIDDDVLTFLYKYDYPGNVRELKNIVERMIALSKDGIITLKEILMPIDILTKQETAPDSTGLSLKDARANFEKTYISEALLKNDYNVVNTAFELGLSTRHLWNKISQFNISLDKK